MRLLQLSTGMGELVDLHPRVTVVTHLDDTGRRHLKDAVIGLAQGMTNSSTGLLEAHGVLFELSAELLALLEISAPDVCPVVSRDDLPTRRVDPHAGERRSAEQTLAEIEARREAAEEADAVARSVVAVAADAVDAARRALEEAAASAPGRSDGERAVAAQAIERREHLVEQLSALAAEQEAAAAASAAAESAAAEARTRREEAAVRRAAVVARLEQSRLAIDPEAEVARDAARAELAALEAAIDEERQAEARAADEEDEEPAERRARLDAEIEALERRQAAFGPTEPGGIAELVAQVRGDGAAALVPNPEAIAIADELARLEAELVDMEAVGGTPGSGLPEARARLDFARQALVEAERAARPPALGKESVERLEQAHADLLEALDGADVRFARGRARAARRVEALRAEERSILDELGFTSYADYVMGGTRRQVEPERETALAAARAELARAEQAWRAKGEETEAELSRARRMERRRVLIEAARALLGRPVPPGSVVEELRAMRVEAEPSPTLVTDLQQALDDAGVAVGDESLDCDDLLVLAEAWVSETGRSADRERDLAADLGRLRRERTEAAADGDRGSGVKDDSAEAERAERLAGARRLAVGAEDRLRAHLVAEENSAFLAEELTVAGALEAAAAEAAVVSDAALAAAAQREDDLRAAHEQVEIELAELGDPVVEVEVELPDREVLVAAVVEAEAAHQEALARAADAASARSSVTAQRRQAAADLAAVPDDVAGVEPVSLVDEVEWYLLARLAAQRAVSLAGSIPLVLDDALAAFDDEEVEHVLGRLERMAEAVQVIVVSDDPRAASWATSAGVDRAAVVRPERGSTG